MATEPPKPLSPEEVERVRLESQTVRLENEKLRAANEHLRKELERLREAQRKLAKAHVEIEDTFRRLMGKDSKSPSAAVRSAREAVEQSQRLTGKDRDKPDKQGG